VLICISNYPGGLCVTAGCVGCVSQRAVCHSGPCVTAGHVSQRAVCHSGLCVTAGHVSQRAVCHQAVHLFVCVDDMKCSLSCSRTRSWS